jgi:HSP20 family molecular chaperone IbpA
MTKILFGAHPFLLGFDRLESLVARTVKSSGDAYPPFNIEQSTKNKYRLTLAVAGFSDDELEITLEDNQLIVRGNKRLKQQENLYLHRGIATRQFQKNFVLSDDVSVIKATTVNGLLNIDLERFERESFVKKITISKE